MVGLSAPNGFRVGGRERFWVCLGAGMESMSFSRYRYCRAVAEAMSLVQARCIEMSEPLRLDFIVGEGSVYPLFVALYSSARLTGIYLLVYIPFLCEIVKHVSYNYFGKQ